METKSPHNDGNVRAHACASRESEEKAAPSGASSQPNCQRCVEVSRLLSGVISKSDGHEHFAHVSGVVAHFLFTLLYK